MEEILHNAFDKIHADDEMKKRTICFLSYKMKEMKERRNIVLCISVFLYSVGHSVLVVIAGASIGFVKKMKYGVFSKVLKIVMGAAIMAIALYLFYLGF